MMEHLTYTLDIAQPLNLPHIMRRVADHSARPRYTFMVLDLIARIAGPGGRAGPLVQDGGRQVPIREWLCAVIAPSASRHPRRLATTAQVRDRLSATGRLPADPGDADRLIESEVGERVRSSGMTAVSRAVSELVDAGLLKRHYQGYRVDHENRGAQRLAVYTVPAAGICYARQHAGGVGGGGHSLDRPNDC